mmetsp:Transcript_14410/g.35231  ORF Transcript_14410/g.35231 Transcript_14410/m.35231 type:complete len:262 (+) Transcript_14410:254-1039(+)
MEETIEELVQYAADKAQGLAEGKQFWITLAGPPGGGKTTMSAQIVKKLSERGVPSVVVPMDGFHYYRRELEAMPDPEEARNRRGSHWTFNSKRLVEMLTKVKGDGCGMLPSFDHAVADPIEDDIQVSKTDKIVLVEGNYLLLYDEEPWAQLKGLFDERWFVACDIELLRERVINRNSAAWGWDKARTAERVDYNDVPNAKLVAATVKYADRVIQSVQEARDVDPTPKSPSSRSALRTNLSSVPAMPSSVPAISADIDKVSA